MGIKRSGRLATGMVVLVMTAAAAGSALAQPKAPAPLHVEGSAAPEPWKRYGGWNTARWDTYNTLARRDLTPPPGKEIELTGAITGDARKGQELAFSRTRGGGCLACHVMGTSTQEAPGNFAPDLSEIGTAGRTDQWLFNYVFDARVYNPETSMPPWGAHGFYTQDEIRDIVAFLKTLKTPAAFKSALDDPGKRPTPVEDRDALDPFINPAAERIEVGQALAAKTMANGKSCVSCHADPKATFAGWATSMPKWEPRLNKVLGVEEFIYRHAKATLEVDWRMQSTENTDLTIFLHSLSNGREIRVDVSSPEAKAAVERGKSLTETKIGQLNFACVDCHTPEKGALKWLRGQWLGEFRGQLDHFPTWRTSRGSGETWDVRKRFQWCAVQVRANELPPDAKEYGDLEIFLKSLNQGLKLTAPNIRH
ncbi:sulfur oxidation c-type cytochrome SoxA [Reyranella sp. CPCC 100927]|uniref:sulfur oxidation c-type cytochrome SoxA n=1 Tax=Reyranella sp. CPCC 100927 TaxID=2599616 RepID=UPI0021079C0D|nr:sulfur oxidation c-type cytochrome SoxA [Reyranella sp. CPCC 100927]